MPVDSSLLVISNDGPVRIDALSEYERKFAWDHKSATFRFWPRRERWYGGYGIYLPELEKEEDGLSHVVLQENQLHFRSTAEIVDNLETNASDPNFGWSSSGLAVSVKFIDRSNGTKVLSSVVVQYCLNGDRPHGIKSHGRKITLIGPSGKPTPTLPCRHVDSSAYFNTWLHDHGLM